MSSKKETAAPKKESLNNIMKLKKPIHKRLKKAKDARGTTYNELVDSLLDTLEVLEQQDPLFIVGKQVYTDVADARGVAIMQAVKEKREPQMPEIAYVLGRDDGK